MNSHAMADPGRTEIERIRAEYARRRDCVPPGFYSWCREENLFFVAGASRQCLRMLAKHGKVPFGEVTAADIGCGTGEWLLEFIQWGARPENLCGIDLLEERVALARQRLPSACLVCGDARRLPWPDHSFDIVSQFMMFSSILDVAVRRTIAAEMLRVLRPGGSILWYDCRRANPFGSGIRAIRRKAIAALFPGCSVASRSVTLAPPLARRIVPLSWTLASLLETVPLLRTHLVAWIAKPCD
jgi:SAM-dependent methyltransferase